MKVIVTLKQIRWEGYYTVRSLSEVIDWGGITHLIYNESDDAREVVFAELGKVPEGVKVLYVSNYMFTDNRGDALFAFFKSRNAYIYSDVDEVLGSAESLNYVIENLGEVGTELAAPNTDNFVALNYYVNMLIEGRASASCITTIDALVKDLGTELQMTDNATKRMTKSLLHISKSLSELSKRESQSHDELLELSSKIENMASSTGGSTYIAKYSVPFTVKQVCYVKAFGDVPFLVTFFKYYSEYLRNRQGVQAKTLIIRPALLIYDKVYARDKTIFKLDSGNVSLSDLSKFNMFVTYEPIKKIFDKFFEDSACDVYFVLDLTQQTTEIMQGHMVTNFGAYSSIGLYNDLCASNSQISDLEHSIFSDGAPSESINITRISGFDTIPLETRSSKHFIQCKNTYVQMDSLLGV